MKVSPFSMGLLFTLLAVPALRAQELSPRVGISAFVTQPADSGGKLYGSGWKVNLTIHVRREAQVEGRVRMEFGEFSEGKTVLQYGTGGTRYSARTRLVGYDWLIPLGEKRETGLDFILGMGGAHWFRQRAESSLQGDPYPYSYSHWDDQLAFAATAGIRFRLSRQVELELHHVFTSLPGNQRDFEDGELSHTALGLGVRF